ncbi:MAG: hypothetical protein P1U54_03830 [Immundisolibacteraceae bacterium]|nr:hypothetical protein [Immundisolibacteraceae bacterium]
MDFSQEVIGVKTRLALCSVIMIALVGAGLSGCQPPAGKVKGKAFSIDSVMKSDLDVLVEVHQRQTLVYLQELTRKLYRRNPRELYKMSGASIDSRLNELFPARLVSAGQPLDPVGDATADAIPLPSVELLNQAFDEAYRGDRVLALMAGLRNMVMSAYNEQTEFYYLDTPLDPQKFYNSARNVEIVLWRLSHHTRTNGQPWLLSNGLGPEVNLSYERLFGKLIGQLDMMALMVAEQRNIQIKNLMRSVASAVFLPV